MSEGGCTNCGNKAGCSHRKTELFAALDAALGRLYPTRRWGDLDEDAALGAGVTSEEVSDLAQALASRLRALVVVRPGSDDEWCDYLYVLCVGRAPSLVAIREGAAPVDEAADGVEERYLRVALSKLARFAAVEEVAIFAERRDGALWIRERARTGVFDPVLLDRYRRLVAELAAHDILNVDFGEIVEPPDGFEWPGYVEAFGRPPAIANFFFYPHPPGIESTTTLGTVEAQAS